MEFETLPDHERQIRERAETVIEAVRTHLRSSQRPTSIVDYSDGSVSLSPGAGEDLAEFHDVVETVAALYGYEIDRTADVPIRVRVEEAE
jgi:hypothetical protein